MFQENTNQFSEVLIQEVFDSLADDIGLEIQDLNTITQKLDTDSLNQLIKIGWNANEIKDLLIVILNASDETRIGVFGSMSRGKTNSISPSSEKLAHDSSDIDILIETSKLHPTEVNIFELTHPSQFSRRMFNIFAIKQGSVQHIFGDDYASVIWVYDNPDFEQIDNTDAAIYRFIYGI